LLRLGTNNSGLECGQVNYLKKKVNLLEEKEKMCCLLLDEVYVKQEMTYKGGKVEGLVHEGTTTELASTVQVFMITSIMSKYKDVVGLFPVKNLNTELLYKLTKDVLCILTEIGFKVLCLISDNNKVNRNTFVKLCGGVLKPKFVNPFCETQNIYVLFDTVHLFKCIRNNWLNQVDNKQSVIFPNFENNELKEFANVADLKHLHSSEEHKCVKLAPALSKKVLYPTSIERQNVLLCCKLFDEKNIAALRHTIEGHSVESCGTANFLEIILKWWKIVNVKYNFKWLKFNDPYFKSVTSIKDDSCMFLQQFCKWLIAWNNIVVQGEEPNSRRGKLSNQTQEALLHTVTTLLEIIKYLTNDLKLSYILLGKFQTDNLEARFGQYRQMSGACYHVSVKQILESENKIKALSFIKLY